MAWKRFFLEILNVADIIVFGGLGLVGYGVYQIYPPYAWITVGGVLMIFGLWRFFRP